MKVKEQKTTWKIFLLWMWFAPCVAVERERNWEACVFWQLVFSDLRPEPMFWHLLPAPVIGGQVCRPLSLSAHEWIDKKLFFDEKRDRLGRMMQNLQQNLWQARLPTPRPSSKLQKKIWKGSQCLPALTMTCWTTVILIKSSGWRIWPETCRP